MFLLIYISYLCTYGNHFKHVFLYSNNFVSLKINLVQFLEKLVLYVQFIFKTKIIIFVFEKNEIKVEEQKIIINFKINKI